MGEELRIDSGLIPTMGRLHPVPDVEAYPGGLRVRVDFRDNSELWVDLFVPWDEILRAKAAMDLWIKQNPAPSMRTPPK